MEQCLKSNKQQLSDARRLKSLKQRHREKSFQIKQITASLRNLDSTSYSNSISFGIESNHKTKENSDDICCVVKPSLFESSDSEDDKRDDDERFEIKEQYEGEKGRQLFEINSSITDERFKLDSRFKECDDEFSTKHGDDDRISNENMMECEKDKNLEILEQVLGFQVPKRPPDSMRKKKYVRFDPESESASEYIKKPAIEEKSTAETKKNVKISEDPPSEPVVSKERFFEVTSNLKHVLNASTEPFSFSQKFHFSAENQDSPAGDDASAIGDDEESRTVDNLDKKDLHIQGKTANVKEYNKIKEKQPVFNRIEQQKRKKTFFVCPDDPRLKEGVEFFRRTKSMDEVRQEWMVTRDLVVDMYKKNRRLSAKTRTPRKKVLQQNFVKRKFTRR